VYALLISFGVVFVAELGDKSQLMAMTFAARYRPWIVLAAISAATAVVHLASVAIGLALGVNLPAHWIELVAGVAFVVFGAWTLRGDSLSSAEEEKTDRSARSVFWSVAVAFFLAELGDKTMLATITLATDHGWLGTWIGSTAGMVAADALAIGVGAVLGRKLPGRAITIGAAVIFFAYGGWLIFEAVSSWPG